MNPTNPVECAVPAQSAPLVTQCAWCRRIKIDCGPHASVWIEPVPSVCPEDLTENRVTHGQCPDCAALMRRQAGIPEELCRS